MLYNIAIVAQVIAIIAVFCAILLLAAKKPTSFTVVILLAFVTAFVQNVGYLFELRATDVKTAMDAIRIEYTGGAFIISLITIFMFKYCNFELPKIVKYFFVAEGVFINLGVWSYEYNGMFYTSAEFISDAPIPHIVLGHGWLYFAFAFCTISELVICMCLCLLFIIRSRTMHMRRNYVILLLVASVPFVGFLLAIMGNFGGFDPTPFSAAVSISIFGYAILRNHVFDVATYASESILDNLDDAIIIINNGNGYEGSNLKAKELFPKLFDIRRGEEIKDKVILSLFDEDLSNEKTIDNMIYDVHITPLMSSDGEIGKTAILFDITNNKKQLEKMRELMQSADQANVAKSAFLANVSHEIRTPINVILGMSEVLYRDHRNSETDEYVLNIKNSAGTLLSLVNDILDFSKIEAGKMEIIDNEYDAKEMLKDIASVYKFRSEKKNIKFNTEVPETLPRYLVGDVVRVKQILNNLLSNAVKYTEQGSITLRIYEKRRNEYELDLIISVEDTGIGIRREDQGKIFSGFSRVDMKKTNSIEGTGLGLNITKQLVALMKGAVNFKSEYGQGSVFTIVIPQKISPVKKETIGVFNPKSSKIETFDSSFTAPDASVLVVDDSKTNLMVVKELLKKTKVNITTADGGEKCLELCGDNHYDIIFLDHRMPGMDGIETFEKLREMPNFDSTPVIMLTANAIGDARDFYLSMNFTDFLSKPITSKELVQMLAKYLPEEKLVHNEDIEQLQNI